MTDRNGYASTASSWAKHSVNTNGGTSSADGIWFGASVPDDSRGALLYDTYVVEELRCEANENMNLLKFEVSIYRDSVTVQLGTLTDDNIELETTALDKKTGYHLAKPEESVTLIDTVEYENLIPGKEYKVTGVLMDRDSGEELEEGTLKETGEEKKEVGEKLKEDQKITAETVFVPEASKGTVDVTFTFNGSAMRSQADGEWFSPQELRYAGEQTATVYTRDKSVMRRLDRLVADYPDSYKLLCQTDIDKTYSMPKSYVIYRKPRAVSDRQRDWASPISSMSKTLQAAHRHKERE